MGTARALHSRSTATMRVNIYRPTHDRLDACAVLRHETPQAAAEEFLAFCGLDGATEESRPLHRPRRRSWFADAFDSRDAAASRVTSEDASFRMHDREAIAVTFARWDTHGLLSEMLGAGWWRFLGPAGEARFLTERTAPGDADEPLVRAPVLAFRLRSRRTLGTDAATLRECGWSNESGEAMLQLVDRIDAESAAETHFLIGDPLDRIVCQVLQRFDGLLRIVGVAAHRPGENEGAAPQQGEAAPFLLSLLFLDRGGE